MGIVYNNGQISGRVGDRIYFITRSGKQGCRIAPKPSSHKATAAQLIQRKRFGMAGSFMRAFLPVYSLLPKSPVKKRIPYPRAVRQVLLEAMYGEYPDFFIDYAKVRLFPGGSVDIFGFGVARNKAGLEFFWSYNDYSYRGSGVVVIAYHPASRQMFFKLSDGGVNSTTVTLDIPEGLRDGHFETWLVPVHADGRTAAGCMYSGRISSLRDQYQVSGSEYQEAGACTQDTEHLTPSISMN